MAGDRDQRMPKYESVAMNIASQILQGRYPPGYRLHGRSTLASLYKVSPETIRKAMALLHQHGVVDIKHGSGVQVLSQDAARDYLQSSEEHQELDAIIEDLAALIKQQRVLTERMEHSLRELAAFIRRE